MPDIVISRAQVEDVAALLPVVQAFYAHFEFAWDTERKRALLVDYLQRPQAGRMWLVKSDDAVAGYALVPFYFSLEFDGPVALLDELFVSAEYRGQGVGAKLMAAVVEMLQAEGIRVVRLEVDERHPEAAALYARQGFSRDGREVWSRKMSQ